MSEECRPIICKRRVIYCIPRDYLMSDVWSIKIIFIITEKQMQYRSPSPGAHSTHSRSSQRSRVSIRPGLVLCSTGGLVGLNLTDKQTIFISFIFPLELHEFYSQLPLPTVKRYPVFACLLHIFLSLRKGYLDII